MNEGMNIEWVSASPSFDHASIQRAAGVVLDNDNAVGVEPDLIPLDTNKREAFLGLKIAAAENLSASKNFPTLLV
ncbi:MAG: hypothetical protein CBE00_09825 [Planctomycetaceae bacterium TMED240]|nr:hypothetical protein [Rhodopirellula sp.]OUX05686.1 MAG: hypothetical protein CBE00_09825 [Planctomycetaceae bacterium TMED240]